MTPLPETPLTRTVDLGLQPVRLCMGQLLSRRIVIMLDNNVPPGTVEIRDGNDRLKGKIINIDMEKKNAPGNRSRTKL